jgi:hypothetical protein
MGSGAVVWTFSGHFGLLRDVLCLVPKIELAWDSGELMRICLHNLCLLGGPP